MIPGDFTYCLQTDETMFVFSAGNDIYLRANPSSRGQSRRSPGHCSPESACQALALGSGFRFVWRHTGLLLGSRFADQACLSRGLPAPALISTRATRESPSGLASLPDCFFDRFAIGNVWGIPSPKPLVWGHCPQAPSPLRAASSVFSYIISA